MGDGQWSLRMVVLVVLVLVLGSAGGQDAKGTVVALYPFEDGQGQSVKDESEAENMGRLGHAGKPDAADPRWEPQGKQGGALAFDGVDDVMVVPPHESLVFRDGIEVEAWVLQTRRTPFARVLDLAGCFDLHIHESGRPCFRFGGADAEGVHGPSPLPLGQWVHLKATYDGRTMALFVNGEKAVSRAYSKPIPRLAVGSGAELCIGRSRTGRPFCGLIDEVKIVNVGYKGPPVAPMVSDADTVGLWRLDDATDAGPNRLPSETRGGAFGQGKVGKAVRLDGKSHLRVPHHPSLDLTDELTIECWVKQTERSPYARIVEKDDWVYGLWIQADGHADFFYRPTPETHSHTISNVPLPLNRWVHVRAEFDGVESILYFDGQEVLRQAVPEQKQTIVASQGDLFIGNRRLGDRGFIGQIDELRLSRAVRRERPPVQTKVATFPSRSLWRVQADARGLRGAAGSLKGGLRDKDGRTIRAVDFSALQRGMARAEIDFAQLAPATYVLALDALDAQGQKLAHHEAQLTKPPKPEWLGAATGVSKDVLPPWTPVRVERDGGTRVELWGRTHRFDRSPLPAQIRSADSDLLAHPMRLVLRSGGKEAELGQSRVDVASAEKHVARLKGIATADAVEARIEVAVEYDGMMRFDMQLGGPPQTELDAAYLELPLAANHAPLMHHPPPGPWFEDATCAGALPKNGWRAPNTWYLWLGDEERGLCWFAEDQAAWGLDPKKPGIEAVPDGNAVRLRVWLVNSPTKLAALRPFTWGLMATPVRPLPKGWQRWRFGSPNAAVNIAVLWSTLRTSTWHSFPVPPDPSWYHAEVRRAHEQGKKFVPYTNFNMQSNVGDEWGYWGEEWNAYAGEGKAADVLAMNVVNVRCCAMNATWCDFITWKYKRYIEEYDSDGFYLDNSIPAQCRNRLHPPEHHQRRHIFAARELMRRFYTVTKQNAPNNLMVCHMSATLCIPVLSFCDAIVDGEQYGWALDEKFDGHYMPLTPLDRVRAQLMATQWGQVPLFLPCNRGPNPWSPALMRELLALMLPHGMRFWFGGHPQTMGQALDVADSFGLDESKFIPYWSVARWRQLAEKDGLVVSAYARDKRKALVIVTNLKENARDVDMPLDFKALGLDAPSLTAMDPLDNLPVTATGHEMRLRVEGRNLRLVMLTGP